MKLIKPKQISGEIMTLMDEAEEKVIIVSPYTQIKKWVKLQNTFDDLKKRNIPIDFFYREGEEKAKKEVESLGVKPIPIESLHCKIYMNEKEGIVSSMNLYQYSDVNSLDIAYKTETKKEYKELKKFYESYILKKIDDKIFKEDYIKELYTKLKEKLTSKINYEDDDDRIFIWYANNKYTLFAHENELKLIGILTKNQYLYLEEHKNLLKDYSLKYKIKEGDEFYYYAVESVISIKSDSLAIIYESDYMKIVEATLEFLTVVNSIKEKTRTN